MSMVRFLACLFAAHAVWSGPAFAQYAGSLTVTPRSAEPGSAITVTGTGYAADTTVTVTFQSAPVTLGTGATESTGSFTGKFMIPRTATPGPHTIRGRGEAPGGGTLVLSASITVTGGGALARIREFLPAVLLALVVAIGVIGIGLGLAMERRG